MACRMTPRSLVFLPMFNKWSRYRLIPYRMILVRLLYWALINVIPSDLFIVISYKLLITCGSLLLMYIDSLHATFLEIWNYRITFDPIVINSDHKLLLPQGDLPFLWLLYMFDSCFHQSKHTINNANTFKYLPSYVFNVFVNLDNKNKHGCDLSHKLYFI